jgi:hypothetical protein
VKPWVEQFLAIRGLSLSTEKTRIVSIDEGLTSLGGISGSIRERCSSSQAGKTRKRSIARLRRLSVLTRR